MLAQFSANPLVDIGDMLGNDFMRYAFLSGTAIALLAGPVGYFVVLRRLAFAGEGLSHVAFTAAIGSVLLGIDPLAGMFVITLGVALGMASITEYDRAHDVVVGTVLSWVLGVGALFLYIYTSSPTAGNNGQIGVNILFGSILGVQLPEAELAAAVAVGGLALLVTISRPLLFLSLDPTVALIRGVRVRLVSLTFLGILAVTVTEAVQVVGALLVLTLLVMPGAIASRWTVRPARAMALGSVISVSLVWLGLCLGYYLPYPVSFFITSAAFAGYVLSLAIAWLLPRWRRNKWVPSTGAELGGHVP